MPSSDTATRAISPAEQYIAPFIAFLILLAVGPKLPIVASWEAALRVLVLGALCVICWPRELPVVPKYAFASAIIGAAVFVLWIAPDLVFPGYRSSALFSNSIVGQPHSSIQPDALRSAWILGWRTARAVVIVPIVEELFWRGWLMRWLIDTDFQKIPVGTYSTFSFWLTAVLFASEHGPYWDVGLITGIIYNLWAMRSHSIADCVLMHAVTNAILSAFVISSAQWQYWQ